MKRYSKQVQVVLAILHDEVNGNIPAALRKMAPDYRMTWVYRRGSTLFPDTTARAVRSAMREAYPITGRKYAIRHIAEGTGVVMVEMVESYPDPKTGKVFRTPLVLVLEVERGKIRTGRHYCDPDLSSLHLTERQVERAYPRTKTRMVIS